MGIENSLIVGEFEHSADFTVLFAQTKDKQALISFFEELSPDIAMLFQ